MVHLDSRGNGKSRATAAVVVGNYKSSPNLMNGASLPPLPAYEEIGSARYSRYRRREQPHNGLSVNRSPGLGVVGQLQRSNRQTEQVHHGHRPVNSSYRTTEFNDEGYPNPSQQAANYSEGVKSPYNDNGYPILGSDLGKAGQLQPSPLARIPIKQVNFVTQPTTNHRYQHTGGSI